MCKVGDTLSQRGLSSHLEMDVSTIRRRGETVIGYARDAQTGPRSRKAHRETWVRRKTHVNLAWAIYERTA